VACVYETQTTGHEFETIVSSKEAVRELLLKRRPDRVCPALWNLELRLPKENEYVATDFELRLAALDE
jgi:hypothetical protein